MAEPKDQEGSPETREPSTRKKRRATKKKPRRARRTGPPSAPKQRGRGPSTPFPPVPFSSVLSFGQAIQQHGAGQPIRRLTLFEKLNRSPESSMSRLLITNSARYGLTKGSYKAEFLELTELGAVVTSPDSDAREKLAASFKLSIEGIPQFKHLYDKNKGNRIPSPEVMRDALEEVDVDDEHRKQCVDLFLENLKDLGLLRTVAGAERIIPIEQALDESPAARSAAASVDASTQAGVQKVVEKSKKSWKNTCFVIAPIGIDGSEQRKHSDMLLEALIRRALEQDWEVIRADQITTPGMISGQVIEHLLRSGLVIADLSFHNPNVFYELAIRHAIGLPTVHIVRKGDGIPFDLKDFRTITIDTEDKYELVAKLETYRAEIANHVRQAAAEGADSSNPVRTFAKGLKVILE
jgi:hypothetical protein